MVVSAELKQQLSQLGWTYHGVCACSVPMHEFKKNKYKIAISQSKNLWNIFSPMNTVLGVGTTQETLIASISSL